MMRLIVGVIVRQKSLLLVLSVTQTVSIKENSIALSSTNHTTSHLICTQDGAGSRENEFSLVLLESV